MYRVAQVVTSYTSAWYTVIVKEADANYAPQTLLMQQIINVLLILSLRDMLYEL